MAFAATLPRRRNLFDRVAARMDESSAEAKEFAERDAAYADVKAFARHAWIQDRDGKAIPFRDAGWAWQWALLVLWTITRLSVVLKARQLGVTWLAAIYVLWFATRKPGQTVLVISRRLDDAKKFVEKVKFIYERLPAWRPIAVFTTDKITFPGTGGAIEALPATEDTGRSRTAQLVVLDEWAHQPFARQIFQALAPVAETGQMIGLSSGNGQGALHSQIYLAAKAGRNAWKAVFIPFSAHPDRKIAGWLERKREDLAELSDAEFAQEYPANDVEAIVATGRTVFRPEDLARQPVRRSRELGLEAGLAMYVAPTAGRTYIIGADVGEGLATSDWSSSGVIDRDSGEQVAQLRGRWAPDIYAAKIDRLARAYGQYATPEQRKPVIVAVERNNHGHAVLLALRALAIGAPYAIFVGPDKRAGWLTTNASRPVLVDQLEAAIRTSAVTLHDAATVDQLSTFAYNDDGKPEAQEGYHDDDVMALGIAWQVRRRSFGRVLDVPAHHRQAAA